MRVKYSRVAPHESANNPFGEPARVEPSFLDRCSCTFTDEKRTTLVSYLSGTMFAVAWWMLIDANVYSVMYERRHPEEGNVGVIWWWFYIPGVLSSIALIMINVVSMEALQGNGESSESTTRARVWMFISFVLAFAGLLGSGWIMTARYLIPSRDDNDDGQELPAPSDRWPGIAVFLQNVFIFVSAIVLRFGRVSP